MWAGKRYIYRWFYGWYMWARAIWLTRKKKHGAGRQPWRYAFKTAAAVRYLVDIQNRRKTVDTFDFGTALAHLRNEKKVARGGWNGKDMWIALQKPDANSKMLRPYIYMRPVDDQLVPWVASQTDLLADDWFLVH